MSETNSTQSKFVDHYYTLGIDVDSNGEIVEETYWSIMRVSRSDKSNAQLRARDVDNLNEAYRVLTTPELRKEYDAERAAVLGPNAKPQPPRPEEPEPPLRVMEKHFPALQREAVRDEIELQKSRFSVPWIPAVAAAGGTAAATILAIIWFFV